MSSPLVPNAPGPEHVFAEGEQPTGFVHFQNLPFLEMVIKFNVQWAHLSVRTLPEKSSLACEVGLNHQK